MCSVSDLKKAIYDLSIQVLDSKYLVDFIKVLCMYKNDNAIQKST